MSDRRKVLDLFEEQNDTWRKRAAEGIERYRKGDGRLTVVDKEGNPVLNENGEPKIETYLVYYKQLTPHQIYYRWMQTYGFLPAGAYPAN